MKIRTIKFIIFTCIMLFILVVLRIDTAAPAGAEEKKAVNTEAEVKIPSLKYPIRFGIQYFYHQLMNKDGSYGNAKSGQPSATALSLLTLTSCPEKYRLSDGPIIRMPYQYLEKFYKEDEYVNGWFVNKQNGVFASAYALMAYSQLFPEKDFEKVKLYLHSFRYPEDDLRDKYFGGYTHSWDKAPSLDASFRITLALNECNEKQSALEHVAVFASRCQDLKANNDQEWAGESGGFIDLPNPGKKVSPNSLSTYQGLYLLLASGISENDPRVKAAWNWILEHYTLSPSDCPKNLPITYYYYCMAKALALFGKSEFKTQDGKSHNWAAEIGNKLIELHKENIGEEGWYWSKGKSKTRNKSLILEYSAYAIQTLTTCDTELKKQNKK